MRYVFLFESKKAPVILVALAMLELVLFLLTLIPGWLFGSLFFSTLGLATLLMSFRRQIAKQKRLERQLLVERACIREQERAFQMLFHSTFEGIVLFCDDRDPNHRIILDANETATQLFQKPLEELVGIPFSELLQSENSDWIGEHRILRRDQSELTIEIRAKPQEYRGMQVQLVSIRDISEQKQIEARLRLSDRMASLGTLAAGVAHEVNNPLTYVLGNLNLIQDLLAEIPIQESTLLTEKISRFVKKAHEGAERVRVIVSDLNTFSKGEGELSRPAAPIDLAHVLDRSVEIAASVIKKKAQVRKNYKTTRLCLANESRLLQVFVNLLVNAAHAIQTQIDSDSSETEHTITISTANCPNDPSRVLIEIRDTGIGIAPEHLKRIFDPFFTTKALGEGTGLGLAISYGIISSYGGEIFVQSALGKGTTFTISLKGEPQALVHAADFLI